MEIIQVSVGQMQANCYLVGSHEHKQAAIVDPGDDASLIMDTLKHQDWEPVMILATHGHFDHLMAAFELQENYQVPFFIHQQDAFLLSRMAETARYFLGPEAICLPPQEVDYVDVDRPYTIGDTSNTINVIQAPGHTPGSVCFYLEKEEALFCGDVLFANGGYGRTDFAYSSVMDLQASIDTLFTFPEDTLIYSGHGEVSTIGVEKTLYV